MNAKEKAKALVCKYLEEIINEPVRTKVAIKCSLILVEEMIKEHSWKTSTAFEKAQLKKWEDVKSELQSF